MLVKDRLPDLKGHWLCEVHEGEVERRPLTAQQHRENKIWKNICDSRGELYLPVHVGEIVSRPIDSFEGTNLVVTTGKSLLLDRLFAMGGPPTQVNSMGVGASATAAAVGDTQLNTTPTILAFDALPTRSGLVVTAIRTFATGEGNVNWQELGLFNGTVNGTSIMLNRIAPIGPFNKTAAVSIVVTVTITQS